MLYISSSVFADIKPPATCLVPSTMEPNKPPTTGILPAAFSGSLLTADATLFILSRAIIRTPSMPRSMLSTTRPTTGALAKILVNPSPYIEAMVLDIIPPPARTTPRFWTNALICQIKNVIKMRPKTSDHITIQPCFMFFIML